MSIYGDIILDHYQFPRNNKKLEQSTNAVHVSNPLCGDELDMQAVIENNIVKEIGFYGQGCAICIASASILTEHAKGKKIVELNSLTPEFAISLLHVELSPNRMKCALLAWEGLLKVIKK
ncbi:SUF system NifU family Fe-S cluster assembly protein [soil metagenome]